MPSISSQHTRLEIDSQNGSFSWIQSRAGLPGMQGSTLAITYRLDNGQIVTPGMLWKDGQPNCLNPDVLPAGFVSCTSIAAAGLPGGLTAKAVFSLAEDWAGLIWKIQITNHGTNPVEIERIQLLAAGKMPGRPSRPGSRLEMPAAPGSLTFYSNGWQSWSYTRLYQAGERQEHSILGLFQEPMVINPGTPRTRRRGHFTSDFFGVLASPAASLGLLAGFLSQKQHFGCLEAWLGDEPGLYMWANGDSARLDPGESMQTDWAVLLALDLGASEPLDAYLGLAAAENQVKNLPQAPAGWCSWYHFYQNISEGSIRTNLKVLQDVNARLPLNLVQIDDGFEKEVGDWLEFRPGFPEGVQGLAAEIKAAGFMPGLWLAPFIVHPKSDLARQHPDWLLQNRRGRPANAGYVWNRLNFALDLTVPAALECACHVVHTAAHEWGYPYLKLDFLYAAALQGRYKDPTRTRAQVLRTGLQALRDAAGPDTFLLGCGMPLGSGLGLVEANRIGPDVSGGWLPEYGRLSRIIRNEHGYPSARNSIHNILTRAPLHNRWWVNDPDCLLVRPDTRLSLAEVHTLATAIALTGGSLLISDDLPALPEERLRLAEVLVPLVSARPAQPDLFTAKTPACLVTHMEGPQGEWWLAALFNWADTARPLELNLARIGLPAGMYLARSFWDGKFYTLETGQPVKLPADPHGPVLLAIWPRRRGPAYAGSSLHISQGMEVSTWRTTETSLEIRLSLPRQADGEIFLAMDTPPLAAWLDGTPAQFDQPAPGLVRFPLGFDREAALQVSFNTGEKG